MNKYDISLEYIKNYLLKKINPISIFVHGSYATKPLFNEEFSDIDIIATVDNLSEKKATELITSINSDNKNNIDKHPIYINDNVATRVEFYVEYNNIAFDITIMDNSWQERNHINNTCYDSFEILLGIYDEYNIPLYGIVPKKLVYSGYHGFYYENLRKKRLKVLADRLNRYVDRLDNYMQTKNDNMFDFACRLRAFFIKYLFIYYKKYPINLNKHLSYQFKNILNLDDAEINILMFKQGTLDIQIKLLNELVKKYLR